MIRINVIKKNNIVDNIILEGHANYGDYGKDIVCAAVSATYLCTLNAILSFNEDAIEIDNTKKAQKIKIKNNDKVTLTLLDNMIRCFESLEKQYPKNINLDKEEK